jgi:uncharacterized protein
VNLFGVNIVGLSLSVHQFQYDLDDRFFKQYGTEVVSKGKLSASVALNKHETFLEASFAITGTVELVCDRSLDTFDHPIEIHQKMVYKYGDEDREVSDDVQIIHRDTATLDVGQPMYEFILLAVPMKKLHPRFASDSVEEDSEEGKIIYSSSDQSTDGNDDSVDPRWEILKKLK